MSFDLDAGKKIISAIYRPFGSPELKDVFMRRVRGEPRDASDKIQPVATKPSRKPASE